MATEEEKLIPQRATNDVGVKRDPDLGDSDHKPKLRASDGDDTAYFSYYSQLQHQASMMQDAVRSGVYQRAILGHSGTHFAGKLVMDVGAGNGILSIFAIQAGAARVYAIEASDMVEHLRTLAKAATGGLATKTINDDEQWYLQAQGFDARAQNTTTSNPWLAQKLVPVASKVEAVTAKHLDGNEKVDTIVSECLGVLLVHERMVSAKTQRATASSDNSPRRSRSSHHLLSHPIAVRIIHRRARSLLEARWGDVSQCRQHLFCTH